MTRYPVEVLGEDDDDGTMPGSVEALGEAVIGHRIVKAERASDGHIAGDLVLTLDTGARVIVADTSDCCAYTELQAFLLHPELVDHVITGVGTTGQYSDWYIYADAGDVLSLSVGWSAGNPFYYRYGFSIQVEPSAS